MTRFALAAAVALGITLVAATSALAARETWIRSEFTLGEALDAGFTVVDTYHTSQGHLVFVLQHGTVLLLCNFGEPQADACLELGAN